LRCGLARGETLRFDMRGERARVEGRCIDGEARAVELRRMLLVLLVLLVVLLATLDELR